MKAVKHPNFKIWYDAGNIIYYTGKDPVEELKPIAQHVTGFCAKDCAALKSDVMIQFGTGKVDFAARLRHAEGRRLRRTDHGRVLQDRRDRRRDDSQCASQPGIPRNCAGARLAAPGSCASPGASRGSRSSARAAMMDPCTRKPTTARDCR